MKPILLLLFFSAVLRFLASQLKAGRSLALALPAWALLGVSGWSVASALGAWTPFWYAALPTALLGLSPLRRRRGAAAASDVVAVAVAAFASHPPLAPLTCLLAAGIAVLLGAVFDRVATVPLRRGVRAAVAVVLVGAAAALPLSRQLVHYAIEKPEQLRYFGITPAAMGERVVLSSGDVAWIDEPRGTPTRGALFFHGYHEQGASQSSALAIRRALLEQGYLVLSLDARAFGESPPPAADAPVSAWDPHPAELLAYGVLRERLGNDAIVIVGHSMGTGAVARMLASDRPARAMAMLGAGFTVGKDPDGDYWYGRFNKILNFDPPLPRERFGEIARAYHDKRPLVLAIPEHHAPLLFVEFLHENADLKKSRDEFFELIKGPKAAVMCPSSHYLYTDRVGPFLVGNPRPTGAMSRILKDGLDLTAPAVAGAPEKKA